MGSSASDVGARQAPRTDSSPGRNDGMEDLEFRGSTIVIEIVAWREGFEPPSHY